MLYGEERKMIPEFYQQDPKAQTCLKLLIFFCFVIFHISELHENLFSFSLLSHRLVSIYICFLFLTLLHPEKPKLFGLSECNKVAVYPFIFMFLVCVYVPELGHDKTLKHN